MRLRRRRPNASLRLRLGAHDGEKPVTARSPFVVGSAPMPAALAARVFLAFAFGYFFSALLRAVTATLAPVFAQELGLNAADLGLLAGAYFFGFSLLQLPLGAALDRFGPKRVLLALTTLAAVGCAAFAASDRLSELIVARALIGIGLAAGLMAPLTCYRTHYSADAQLRANSWMLMTGSLGMVASTLPVQWLLPIWGWRGLFWGIAGCLLASMLLVTLWVPSDPSAHDAEEEYRRGSKVGQGSFGGYALVFRHPEFRRSAPLGFFVYGGMIAVQSLWAGPWLTQVAGWTAEQSAAGLFGINLGMLCAFMAWGALTPTLFRRGFVARTLILAGLPISFVVLAWIALKTEPAGAGPWALWCVSCTFVSLSQPAVGQAFPKPWAGRALSAFNLVIFAGVFAVQWGVGLAIDKFRHLGMDPALAFRSAFALFAVLSVLSYLWYWRCDKEETSSRQ